MAEENEREMKQGLQVRGKTNTHLCDNNKQHLRQKSLPDNEFGFGSV
jgi:hypothetical protein